MIPLGVANSSSLIILGRIGRLDLLERCFERILVPESVANELGKLPPFVDVQAVTGRGVASFPPRIHKGEAEVILLGFEYVNSVLILDDWYAREFARSRALKVIGTIGILLRNKRAGRLDQITPVMNDLIASGFHVSERVVLEAKRLAGE